MSDDTQFPRQQQAHPGSTGAMEPEPHDEMRAYRGSGKLDGRRALITGGDSGIGRAVAAAFAKEGADVAIAHLAEDEDARHTLDLVEAEGRRSHAVRADLSIPDECARAVREAAAALGGLDYSASKGAVNALTYSLAQALAEKGIRVNAVAPGPVWTPLIPSTMPEEKVESFGSHVPMGRAAQPDEIAPSYVFFASGELSSYYSGEVLAPTGGETLPG